MERLNPNSRRDAYGSKINRDHSLALVYGIPWLTIMLGSLTPLLPIIAPAPVFPPLGYIMLLGWRLSRPGLLPMWAGLPLGLVDDLFSGQPLGCGVLLFSLTMIGLELLEARFPWRNFWQDWLLACILVPIYLVVAALLSGTGFALSQLYLLIPQILLSLVAFPIVVSLVSVLDRLRLRRFKPMFR
ncbi:MAG: rod shape-determining protein MreD [Erythrobacter sp.]|nr:rod shape-determining protein MreD [Erythrobacter sp.]